MNFSSVFLMLLVTNGVWLLTQAVAWEKFEDEIMDELKNRDEKSREKRAIYVNNKLPIDMSLFVNLPISVAFRSVLEGRSARAAASPTEDSKMEHTYDPVIYRPNLKKLDAYFTYLEIKEEVCRQRFLCEMGLDTERFGPIYNLFKNQLREKESFKRKLMIRNRFYRYFEALREGEGGRLEACNSYQRVCSYGAKEVFNPVVLRLLNLAHRHFKLEFVDDL